MAYAKGCGIAHYQSCAVLQIQVRRVERWAVRLKCRGTMAYGKAGPKQVVHAILPAEREAVLAFVGREETVDYSLQLLAIKGGEQWLFYLSASSVRVILQEQGWVMTERGGGAEVAPGRSRTVRMSSRERISAGAGYQLFKDRHSAGVLVFVCRG